MGDIGVITQLFFCAFQIYKIKTTPLSFYNSLKIISGKGTLVGGETRLLQPPAGAGQRGQDHGGHPEEDVGWGQDHGGLKWYSSTTFTAGDIHHGQEYNLEGE